MQLDPRTLEPISVYKLLISSVVPRPIAWVSSVDASGVHNLAPFSYFMAITDEPPTIAFSCSARPGVGKKDTLRNVEATGEFVVNIADDDRAEAMNLSSGDFPPDVDEFAVTRLTAAPSAVVKARSASAITGNTTSSRMRERGVSFSASSTVPAARRMSAMLMRLRSRAS